MIVRAHLFSFHFSSLSLLTTYAADQAAGTLTVHNLWFPLLQHLRIRLQMIFFEW